VPAEYMGGSGKYIEQRNRTGWGIPGPSRLTEEFMMKQKQEMGNVLRHEMSMKLMVAGQTLLEIEDRHMGALSRGTQERLRAASRAMAELADECMTELTRARMMEWEREAGSVARTSSEKMPWEEWTPDQMKAWRRVVMERCWTGFTGPAIDRTALAK
jgi:hypothetical protein